MTILLKNDPVMQKARKVYKEFTADEKLVELNEARMKHLRDQESLVDGAREEGREEGREKNKLETAKKMLENGFDTAIISRITGLTAEEIDKL